MTNFFSDIFPKTVTKKECSDTGMAMTLICLLIGYFTGNTLYYKISILVLVMTMAFPMFFYYIAILWLGLTKLLGVIVSRVVLSVVYIVFLMPVGVIRRSMGKDSMNIKGFKTGKDSVMITRDIEFTANDIKNPY